MTSLDFPVQIYTKPWYQTITGNRNMSGDQLEGMLTRKQCPKCGGNIYLSNDYYGRYEQCLQCGYTCDLDSIDGIKKQALKENEKFVSV